jgi:hypothetical protein
MTTQADPGEAAAVHVSRRMWLALEPYHAMIYFIPETRRHTDELGLKGGWMSYFGTRAAPLGPVPAEVVIALFYGFHPAMVRRAIPDAWSLASPAALVAARLAAADEGLRRLLGPTVDSPELAEAAGLAEAAARATSIAGRPLGAAHAALPWSDVPHLRLWQAATILREARGDGHVAALLLAGLSPCEALVSAAAVEGGPPGKMLQGFRRWSDEEWDAAVDGLRSRGWLDEGGAITGTGRAGRAEVERRTDEAIRPTWDALGPDATARLEALMLPVRDQILAAGGLPVPNPLGLT